MHDSPLLAALRNKYLAGPGSTLSILEYLMPSLSLSHRLFPFQFDL